MLLYLIRHGQTDYNATGRIQGWLDVPLNEAGHEQARRVARRFVGKPIHTVYASPLQRAADTARAICAACALPLTLDDRLREYNMGDWEGLTGDEINAISPVAHHADPEIVAHGGESAAQMRARVRPFIDELLAAHGAADTRVAVVSHGGTLGALISAMLDMPPLRRAPFVFGNTAVSEMLWQRGHWRVRALNDRHHLI